MIPEGHTIEDIKTREQIIRNFYREWKEKNPSQRKFNLSLKEYINIRMVSIVETSEHAAKSYLSTLAVLQFGFHFDRSQKSIRQEAEIRQCESKTV